MKALNVHDANRWQRCSKQVWVLGQADAHQQSAVRTPLDRKTLGASHAFSDQVLSAGDEVIKLYYTPPCEGPGTWR